jgi:hypothetical protein
MNFLLDNLIVIIQAIQLSKAVVLEENIPHNFEISIEGKHFLPICKAIDAFVDPRQIVLAVTLESILLE